MNPTWVSDVFHRKTARALRRRDPRSRKGTRTLLQVELLEERQVLSTPASLAGSALLARPAILLNSPAATNEAAGSSVVVGLRPAQMRTAYRSNDIQFNGIVGNGSGETIAIVDAYDDPRIAHDLVQWDATFGFDDPPSFIKLNEYGGSNLPPIDPMNPPGTANWEGEEALDVEWAHAIAPKASLVLIECNSAGDDLYTGAVTAARLPGVVAVSMSWYKPEFQGETALDSDFTTPPGHPGVTFVAASGDNGAFGNGLQGDTYAANYPAASPNVLAVGGSILTVDADNEWKAETGWGSGLASYLLPPGGSGGGLSTLEPQPAYQTGLVTQSRNQRAVPDVALDAGGAAVCDSYNGGLANPWYAIGGTSLATPMWAALIAIADQGRALHGLGSLDGFHEALPKLYNMVSDQFHDVTTGNNGYADGPGYDLVTGRGTPKANRLVPDLAGGPTYGPGVYDPSTGNWFLRDEDSAGNPDIPVFPYGGFGQPIAGDWDGNGTTTPGIYTPTNGVWFLNNMDQGNGSPITFQFGYPGTIAVAGDWMGDGTMRAGIYDPRSGVWYLDKNPHGGDGSPIAFQFGFAGTIPVVGDFFGTGSTTVGLYYPPTGTWYIAHHLGADASPVVFQFGFVGTTAVAGDWAGDGITRVGIYNPYSATWFLDHNPLAGDGSPTVFQDGFAGVIPVAGRWNYVTTRTPGSNGPLFAGFRPGSPGVGRPPVQLGLFSVVGASAPGQLGADIPEPLERAAYREFLPEPMLPARCPATGALDLADLVPRLKTAHRSGGVHLLPEDFSTSDDVVDARDTVFAERMELINATAG